MGMVHFRPVYWNLSLIILLCCIKVQAVDLRDISDDPVHLLQPFVSCQDEQDQLIRSLEDQLHDAETSVRTTQRTIILLEHLKKEEQLNAEYLRENEAIIASLDQTVSQPVIERHARQDQCQNQKDRLRLTNGVGPSEGRVEVWVGNQWSPVSETAFRTREADLVCSVLGHGGSKSFATSSTVFGEGNSGSLLLDDACRRSAGVICEAASGNYQLRLENGSNVYEGRLEINIGGQWGTVCHSGWDWREATVACNLLGYGGLGAAAVGGAAFGQGSGPVWLRDLSCLGNEAHLLHCPSAYPAGTSPCAHGLDAGIICGDWLPYPLRLVNGSNAREGRVEIHVSGQWGTINSNRWDAADARVACRWMGYESEDAQAMVNGHFGAGTGPTWLGSLDCTGSENHLLECPSIYAVGQAQWNHTQDAGVIC